MEIPTGRCYTTVWAQRVFCEHYFDMQRANMLTYIMSIFMGAREMMYSLAFKFTKVPSRQFYLLPHAKL